MAFNVRNYGSDPVSPNTTYVQADPSTFRAVVQKLTGAPEDPSQKLPLTTTTLPSRFVNPKPASSEMGPRRPAFKLHERRQTTKKLELLNLTSTTRPTTPGPSFSPSSCGPRLTSGPKSGGLLFSPVSPLDFLTRGSPTTPASPCPEEERAIAEKGFYLHPSPLSTPRGSQPPELLVLFPLQSPRDCDNSSTISSSSS
ncbi:hypothetical protein UlMin_017250 [Ulmus minor]